jgi:hypothetical protein
MTQKHFRRTYESCVRCGLVVATLHDGRISPHRLFDNTDWCPGAHRPDPMEAVPQKSFDLTQHRAHHQQLYRALRELMVDWSQQTGEKPNASLLEFVGWCRRQHDVPDHDNVRPHFKE